MEADSRVEDLTGGSLLRKNVRLNLVAWVLPAIAALISIPLLARGLGPARFGLVALAWSAVGIFSLFDFGIGRALTRIVAERLATRRDHEIRALVWSASWLLLTPTIVLGLLGFAFAETIVARILNVPADIHTEAVGVVRLLSISIPPLAHGVVLRGVLEAAQKFGLANMLRVPLGVVSYAGALVAVPLGADARVAVGVIVAARFLYWLAHFPAISRAVAGLGAPQGFTRNATREIFSVGGWITISNVISPIIVQADRLFIAAALPIAASGFYAAAAEVAMKQWLFTAALTPVLFAALAAAIRPAPQRAVQLMDRSARLILLVLFPVALGLVVLAEPGLRFWMGSAYSPVAAAALRWLSIGVYVNALAQVAYAVLQGGVDSRSPAILHMVELPIYAALLLAVTPKWGIEGVALVWMARMIADTVALWWLLHRKFVTGRHAIVAITRLALVCLVTLLLAAGLGARIW